MTRDVEGAKRYYEDLCGWSFISMPMGPDGPDYILGLKDGKPVVGMMDMNASSDDASADPFWMSYFAVDDVDAAVAKTIAAGGTVTREPFDVPDTGRIATVVDPTGALIGLMTPVPMPGS